MLGQVSPGVLVPQCLSRSCAQGWFMGSTLRRSSHEAQRILYGAYMGIEPGLVVCKTSECSPCSNLTVELSLMVSIDMCPHSWQPKPA